MKVVINGCFGGFSLSIAAALELYEGGWTELGTPVDEYFGVERDPDSIIGRNRRLADWRQYLAEKPQRPSVFLTIFSKDESHVISQRPANKDRSDPRLVAVVERMGEAASGQMAKLKVVEIPDDVEWVIDEYDGQESVHETHREWR